jgi:hypothetical protein
MSSKLNGQTYRKERALTDWTTWPREPTRPELNTLSVSSKDMNLCKPCLEIFDEDSVADLIPARYIKLFAIA